MMWNLQSYSTTVFNERMWHVKGVNSKHTLTPPTYFQGIRTANSHDLLPLPTVRHFELGARTYNGVWGQSPRGAQRQSLGQRSKPHWSWKLINPWKFDIDRKRKICQFPVYFANYSETPKSLIKVEWTRIAVMRLFFFIFISSRLCI